MYEFIKDTDSKKRYINKAINIVTVTYMANGVQTDFSVGESIGTLFGVSINGLAQERDVNFSHVNYTSKISFSNPPLKNDIITIQHYPGRTSVILDNTGKLIQFTIETFTFTSSLVFNVGQSINSVVGVEINGLAEKEGVGYEITGSKQITLLGFPVVGSRIMISYVY